MNEIDDHLLHRTYRVLGLDRVLYAVPPQWPEGTFEQADCKSGRLILRSGVLVASAQLQRAIADADRVAEQFRLAIARRTGCPLTLLLESSRTPAFDPAGTISVHDGLSVSDEVFCRTLPSEPPEAIEQVPTDAARWILTYTEARHFSDHPDEVFKRLYLLIEELLEAHRHQLNVETQEAVQQVKWIRDFVSHSTCKSAALCSFIVHELPDAVVSTTPLLVRFDRTSRDHRNFVGRHEPIARHIATTLLDAAIAAL